MKSRKRITRLSPHQSVFETASEHLEDSNKRNGVNSKKHGHDYWMELDVGRPEGGVVKPLINADER